jgi:RimJ/RimL family protein N-acetyltransferase
MEECSLKGRLVQLSAVEPNEMAEAAVRWGRDSEYLRLSMIEPVNQFSVRMITDWIQKDQENDPPKGYDFAIRTLEDDHLVGNCGLGGDIFPHGEAFVGIGIGERELWNKGYGTDAMMVILRYAFMELNLRRVALSTSAYNPRAIRSYEKAGFVHEGRMREFFRRDGQRCDIVFMGILREEWLAISQPSSLGQPECKAQDAEAR